MIKTIAIDEKLHRRMERDLVNKYHLRTYQELIELYRRKTVELETLKKLERVSNV